MTDASIDQWVDLCHVDELPHDGGKYVVHDNRTIALFRDGCNVRVIDDTCPHAGASLSAGSVRDGCVMCPWHAWEFELSTGQCPDNRDFAVRSYSSRIVDGRVQVRLD